MRAAVILICLNRALDQTSVNVLKVKWLILLGDSSWSGLGAALTKLKVSLSNWIKSIALNLYSQDFFFKLLFHFSHDILVRASELIEHCSINIEYRNSIILHSDNC